MIIIIIIIIIIMIKATVFILINHAELAFGINKRTYENCKKRKLCRFLHLSKKA
jgi:hypothetical protein